MKTFLELSPKKYICKITCPSLVINGGKDVQVYAKSNIECFKTNINPTTNCTIKIYDGLNHLFQHCKTGRVGEYYKIEETISPDVLKDITNWINQL